MPPVTPDIESQLGLTTPEQGSAPIDPKTKIKRLPDSRNPSRQRITFKPEDLALIKKTLKTACEEWETNSNYLRSKLQRIVELTSGVKTPINFPWRNASNIHVPLIEMHMEILHSSIEATMLDVDPLFTVRTQIPTLTPDESIDPNIENFLTYKVKNELGLDRKISEAIRNSLRDPLAIGVMDWTEEMARRFDVKSYSNLESFQADYPSPQEAGVSLDAYQSIVQALLDGEPVNLRVQEEYAKYRGPQLRIAELKDMVIYPATSRSFEYAQFVGDYVTERAAYFQKGIKYEWFDKDETEAMLKHKSWAQADSVTQSQDRIEGLSRSLMANEPKVVQGCLKLDLDNDGEEEMYMVVYCPETDNLLRGEMYPYWHNRLNYIPFRVKRKTNRLLGECVYDWVFDINEEVDTQHNQRINSRTITSVPSFKKKTTAAFDPSREDQKFYPGVTFKVSTMDEVQQFEIKQTDISTSMQEESWLFQIAEYRTGASLLQGGNVQARDPRAPFKKVAALLSKSAQRIDPYIKELKTSVVEIAQQMLELYYQFSPSTILFPHYDPTTSKWMAAEIMRSKLRSRNMTIDIARTTADDNPDAIAQRRLVEYNILSQNPIINQNLARFYALTRELVLSLRKKHANDLVPPMEQFFEEIQKQQDMINSAPPDTQMMLRGMLDRGGQRTNQPTGTRQGGPVVTPGSVGNSPSPGV